MKKFVVYISAIVIIVFLVILIKNGILSFFTKEAVI